MDADDLNALAKTRVQVPDGSVKKIVKDFYRLARADVQGDERLAAHEIFLLDLKHLAANLSKKGSRLQKVTQVEVAGYEAEGRSIEQSQSSILTELDELKSRLIVAQSERANQIEYDAIAKTINQLPSRQAAQEAIEKLTTDVQVLEDEQLTYAATWQSRQEAFDEIVNGLVVMSESIRDEKAEQARRRALEEDDDDTPMSNPLLSNLIDTASGASTPQMTLASSGANGTIPNEAIEKEDVMMVDVAVEEEEHEEGEEKEEPEEGEMQVA